MLRNSAGRAPNGDLSMLPEYQSCSSETDQAFDLLEGGRTFKLMSLVQEGRIQVIRRTADVRVEWKQRENIKKKYTSWER